MKSKYEHLSSYGLTVLLGVFLLNALAARAQTNTFPTPTGNVGIGIIPTEPLNVAVAGVDEVSADFPAQWDPKLGIHVT